MSKIEEAVVEIVRADLSGRIDDLLVNAFESRAFAAAVDQCIAEKLEDLPADTFAGRPFERAVKNIIDDYDFDEKVDSYLGGGVLEDKVSEAVHDYDFSGAIEDALEEYDLSGKIEDVVNEHNFASAINKALENYDFSEVIEQALERQDERIKKLIASEVDEVVSERMRDAINDALMQRDKKRKGWTDRIIAKLNDFEKLIGELKDILT